MSIDDKDEFLKLLEERSKRKLANYKPYDKQKLFHSEGLKHRERLFRAGNQLGKSHSGAAECAIHLTGRYPEWWVGRRWDRPIAAWAGGVTGEVTRDTIQRLLIGAIGQSGQGFIPLRDIIEIIPGRGIPDLADTILVRHVSGGVSRLKLKFYEQGRERWQADTVDFVWFDEEPPSEVYTEGLTRTNATGGMVYLTFTPLMGMSEVVMRFLNEKSDDRSDTNMTIEDVGHISEEARKVIINSYPAHEREARLRGTPMLGSGRIFPVTEESIKVPRFVIPPHFFKVAGLDFGWDHPTAGVKLAFDADMDIVYVTHVYKKSEATPMVHASALKGWGKNTVWAWPHDGLQHDKGSGDQLAEIYRREGLNMLPDRATFEDGSNGVEAGLMEMLLRMENGTFKVFDDLELFFEEFRLYHREKGKVVKKFDDILSATRYACMSLRHATQDTRRDVVGGSGVSSMHKVDYNPFAVGVAK